MSTSDVGRLENDLRAAGRDFAYPPTPQLAARVIARLNRPSASRRLSGRWTWAVVTVLVLLSALMLVPPARAAILDFIQIGVVRILRGPGSPPAPVPVSTSTAAQAFQSPLTATPVFQTPLTATPAPSTIPSLLDLAGETTLSEAQAKVKFPILLPTYPSDLGRPDKVYLQDLGGPMLLLVWLDHDHADQVRMSLHEIAAGSWAITKFNPPVIQEVKVNGQRAVWTEGPYMLETQNRNYEEKHLVEGHVLIWTQGEITYRLETALSLEEALKIAESLEPVLSPTPTPTLSAVSSAATQTGHETFTLTGEQAQEIAVFMDFIRAYNNGRFDEALGLLAENAGISDCDYQSVEVVTFQGRSQVAGWLQQRISEHDRLEVSRIENENADPASGKYVIGVTYSRRTSTTLTSLGFVDGIVPKLATKVIFTPEPTRILSFANGPYGGDPKLCRPGN